MTPTRTAPPAARKLALRSAAPLVVEVLVGEEPEARLLAEDAPEERDEAMLDALEEILETAENSEETGERGGGRELKVGRSTQ